MAREQFRVEAERDLAKLRFQYQKELQAMPGQEERIQNRLIAAYKKKFPDADEYTILQAITAKGDRAASPGEQLRAVELINQLGGTPEDIQAGLGVARRVAGVNQQKVMTMADVKATAKARNMTEQQVMDVAKAKGYVIQ